MKQSIRTKIYPLKITNLSLSVCTVLSLLIKSVLYGNSNDFSWYVSDNILMRCRTTASDIGTKYNSVNFFGDVYKYRPTKIKLFSYWWLEAGDKYTIKTPFEDLPTIETFVFNKKMDGFITAPHIKGRKTIRKGSKENEQIQ